MSDIGEIIIFQTEDGQTRIDIHLDGGPKRKMGKKSEKPEKEE